MSCKNNKVLVNAHIFHFQFSFRLEITLQYKEFEEEKKQIRLGKHQEFKETLAKPKKNLRNQDKLRKKNKKKNRTTYFLPHTYHLHQELQKDGKLGAILLF